MGATFSRIKNWTTEILSNTDLNIEIDNILNNLGPAGVDDYSTNSAQMRTQTSPGAVGSESLATSLAGELERLRYVIQRIIGGGTSYWYEAPASTLGDLVAAIGTGLPTYRIVSGRTTGNSSQLCALIPNGVSASVTLTASVTPLVYYIGGVQYSITANQTLTGLSLAPTTNNTCSFNNTVATGQQWTKFIGMYGTQIDVDTMNTSVAATVGQIVGLQAGTEYFMGYMNSSVAITNAWRGAMFNSAGASVTAAGLTDNAEIKLMKLAWIFANTNSSLAVTYSNPTVSAEQPTSPNTGDYWFDLATTAWKTYNSTTWIAANATLIGVTMQSTAACVAARTFDSYKAMSSLNTLNLNQISSTQLQAAEIGAEISVFGNTNRYGNSRPVWDMTADLESGMVESASYTYFAYMKENGNAVLSDRNPLIRRDLQGLYHPSETWRCLGSVFNNAGSNLEAPATTFRDIGKAQALMGNIDAYLDYVSGLFPRITERLSGDVFPASYKQNYGEAANYTVSQNTNQPNITMSLTRGLWKLGAYGYITWTGTPSTAAVFRLNIGCPGGPGTEGLSFTEMGIGGAINARAPLYIGDCVVYLDATTDVTAACAIALTAGAAYGVRARLVAERIDDAVGMP